MKKIIYLLIILIGIIIITSGFYWLVKEQNSPGAPVETDLIKVESPRPNEMISSPFNITGEARGYWFFEASFPLVLTDWDGLIIAEGYATTKDGANWMTEEFVPFKGNLTFTAPTDPVSKAGYLILRRDNPSGLPENDAAVEIPIKFK